MRAGAVRDGMRLAFGTLSVLPVPPPLAVDRSAASVAMMVAVLPGAVIGGLASAVAAGLVGVGVSPLVVGAAAVGVAALLTRFLHLDGLADTTDGLVAGHTAERALQVMHRGDVGPAGASVLVLVLGGQAAAVAAIAGKSGAWWVTVGVLTLAWAASRAVLALLTVAGTRPAQPGGLGAGVLGSVPRSICWLPVAALAVLALSTIGWVGLVALFAAVVAAGGLAAYAHRRLGGLTGDVLGAAVEVALLAALIVLTAA